MVYVLLMAVLAGLFVLAVWRVTAARPNEGAERDDHWVGLTGSGSAGDFEDDPWRGVVDPSPEDVERSNLHDPDDPWA